MAIIMLYGANDSDLGLDQGNIRSTNSYKYLGTNITEDRTSENEMKKRIG